MNTICERLIGTLRRELLDRTLILNQAHLRAVLAEYQEHYNTARPVRAENLVRGPDQQSCLLSRPAVMITRHVPGVRLSPDHAGGFLVAAVSA